MQAETCSPGRIHIQLMHSLILQILRDAGRNLFTGGDLHSTDALILQTLHDAGRNLFTGGDLHSTDALILQTLHDAGRNLFTREDLHSADALILQLNPSRCRPKPVHREGFAFN
jgi:hypothetical protein